VWHELRSTAVTATIIMRILRHFRWLAAFALVFAWSSSASADTVTPTSSVTTAVVVRASASTQSAQVGLLRPGEQALLVGSVPNWFHVQLASGVRGFVSKRWTQSNPSGGPSETFTMDVLDVGTGLGILVRGPDFALIYDGGSNDDLARGPNNRVVAYLKAIAPTLTTIDALILSHPHRDHVELLADVFSAYTVREVWDSGRLNDICGYRAFIKAVRDQPGVRYHNAVQGFGTRNYTFGPAACYGQTLPAETVTLTLDSSISNNSIPLGHNASMTFLYADGSPVPNINDNSLVVRLDLGHTPVLLMGDAEAGGRASPQTPPAASSVEGVLLSCCQGALPARVMVAGHHGSKTSSRTALLDAVGATIFIVSSGPTKYGPVTLPDPEVIAELSSRGQVFRTDLNDATCAMNPAKIGPDADGHAGGCDDIRIVISDAAAPQVTVWHGQD
jgi:competence protein ComEC